MKTKIKLNVVVWIVLVAVSSPAVAEKLCLQTLVNKRTLKVTTNRVIAATCPKGFAELLDTETVKGATGPRGDKGDSGVQGQRGETGRPGFSYSTCAKKIFTSSYTISSTNRQPPNMTGSCDVGAHMIRLDLSHTTTYSADWSLDLNPADEIPPDTTLAGTTTSSSSKNYRPFSSDFWILDQEQVFMLGFSENNTGSGYTQGELLTGTEQHTREHALICCKLSE
jgi:hypothetical protein